MEWNRTRANRGQEFVGVFGREHDGEIRRGFLKSLEKGVRGLIVGSVGVVKMKEASGLG